MYLKIPLSFFTTFFLIIGSAFSQNYTVTVTSGSFDRTETIVSFTFPEAVEAGVYRMKDGSGRQTIVQVNQQNTGWFLLRDLPKGSTRTYTLSTVSSFSVPDEELISFKFDSSIISFEKENRSVLSYYLKDNTPPDELDGRYKRGGYIHPIYSPGGIPLTNHLDSEVHPHHYGVWAAWTKTQFQGRTPDFWNVHDGSARIDHWDSLKTAWTGPVHGGLKAKNHYVDLSGAAPVIAIHEEWQIKVFNSSKGRGIHIFDVQLTHSATQPLVLPEYRYGGLAFRGHSDWNNPENVTVLTSEGYRRDEANGTRARWTLMGGVVNGQKAGVAVLGHPKNNRAPQPIRVHPDTPYLVYAPMQLGDMSIEPESPYIMRYRFITYDGEPNIEQLDQLWNDYAYPPGVTVGSN